MRKKIDWDNVEELGVLSDPQIAKKYGVNKNAVRMARIRRSISPAPKSGWSKKKHWDVDWDEIFNVNNVATHYLYADRNDSEIAEDIGCTASLVYYHRFIRWVAPHENKWSNSCDWGKIFDKKDRIKFSELAFEHGVCRQTVEAAYVAYINRKFGYCCEKVEDND